MADSKISALGAITALTTTDELVVASSGASNKITAANMAKFMPGYEIGYAQITSLVNVTGTSSGAATTVISPGAITFDGAPVLVTVSCPQILCDSNAAGDLFAISIFESSTELGIVARARTVSAADPQVTPITGMYRFTPSVGSHTYTIKCYVDSNASAIFNCGAGGTSTLLPAFVRFTKV